MLYKFFRWKLFWLLLLCFGNWQQTQAQTQPICPNMQNNHWHFGFGYFVDFDPITGTITTGETSAITPTIVGPTLSEGATTVSDPFGDLLFYADGNRVWNNQGGVMDDGFGSAVVLLGSNSGAESVVAVPNPSNPNQYFLVVTNRHNGANTATGLNVSWSLVDMSLNGGLGGILIANQAFPHADNNNLNNFTEKAEIIKHANCRDYWIVMQQWEPSAANPNMVEASFIAYLIDNTTTTIDNNTIAVISTTGNLISNIGPSELRVGFMESSMQGDRIAVSQPRLNGQGNQRSRLDVYNFNNATGVLNGFRNYTFSNGSIRGLEFSPDGTVLFFNRSLGNRNIRAIDFIATASGVNPASTQITNVNGGFLSDSKIGPDGNLYFLENGPGNALNLHAIADPNDVFQTAQPQATTTINITNNRQGDCGNLPATVPLNCEQPITFNDITICEGDLLSATLLAGTNAADFDWAWTNQTTGTVMGNHQINNNASETETIGLIAGNVYSVEVTATNPNTGCVSRQVAQVTVDPSDFTILMVGEAEIGLGLNPNIPASPANCLCGETFRLTDELDWQTGAIWNSNTLDLNQNFTLEANVYLGDQNGADGIAFVMQNHVNGTGTIGRTGGNIGYGNVSLGNDPAGAVTINPSVAIELDVFNNGANNFNDLTNDHLDIVYNGNINNSTTFGAVPLNNVEDGAWHNLRIEYRPCANHQCLDIFFDGVLRATHCDNMITDVFNGATAVNWGFTAATGSSNNAQAVCMVDFEQTVANFPTIMATDATVCVGNTGDLTTTVTGGIAPFSYEWQDATNNIVGTMPNFSTGIVGTYGVTVTDDNGCTDETTATLSENDITVNLQALTSTTICEGASIDFQATATGGEATTAQQYEFTWNQTTPITGTATNVNPLEVQSNFTLTPNILGPGTLFLSVTDGDCDVVAGIPYTVNQNPTVQISASDNNPICLGDEVDLTATVIPNSNNITTVNWGPDANMGNSLTTTVQPAALGTNTYTVSVIDDNGCSSNTASIDVIAEDCCPANGNPDYLQIWEGSTDVQLATYGISETIPGDPTVRPNIFFMLDGNQYILPNKIYIGNNTELVIGGETVADFTNCDVVMGRNSRIRVAGGGVIVANNAIFRPCEELESWRGILFWTSSALAGNPPRILPPRATFNECTFVNAIRAIDNNAFTGGINNPNGDPAGFPNAYVGFSAEITNNLFMNCGTGIHLIDTEFEGSITGNTFKIDEKAVQDNVDAINYDGNVIGFRGIFIRPESTADTYFDIEFGISQNHFIDGTSFDSDAFFEGIRLGRRARGLNISNNQFTNNDRGVTLMGAADISIENNLFEVTRRSNAEHNPALTNLNYQVTLQAHISWDNKALIKNNRFLNSAQVISPTVNNDFEGSGAIYLAGGESRVDGNEIDGFEFGIVSRGVVVPPFPNPYESRPIITNNKISTYLFGIFVEGVRSENNPKLFNYIGCNEIDMKSYPNSTFASTGIYFNPLQPSTYQNVVHLSTLIEGNCVKNAAIAVNFDNLPWANHPLMNIPQFRHNYLYNYSETGLLIDNMGGSTSSNNSFIRNNDAWDIAIGTSNTGNLLSTSDDFGGTAEEFNNPAQITMSMPHTPGLSAASCGNQNLGAVAVDVDFLCHDEDAFSYDHTSPILQRTAQPNSNSTTALTLDYKNELTQEYNTDPNKAQAIIISGFLELDQLSEVHDLYQASTGYAWSSNQSQWIDYYYQVRLKDYTMASQKLAAISSNDQVEVDQVTLEHIYLKRYQQLLLDSLDRIALNDIIAHDNRHREWARHLLHSEKGGHPYVYNQIQLTPLSAIQANGQPSDFSPTGNADFDIYPNPTAGDLNIQIQSLSDKRWEKITLVDVHGRILQEHAVRANITKLDVVTLPQGIYFISLQDTEGQRSTKKFVKQ